MIRYAIALALLPTVVMAEGLSVDRPMVPMAPPGAMAHAAYFTLTNSGEEPRQLIGVTAEGYAMAHLHLSEIKNDVATMSSMDLVEIAPGQSVAFEQGGLHVMLMRPEAPLEDGAMVNLTLEFANGETLPVSAMVMKMMGASHSH